jgi:hypothetical protein
MILKKINKEFEVPDPGEHLAVLADVVPLGVRNTNYGPKDQLRFKWFVQQTGTDGRQLGVIATYNNTLGDGASLVQVITDLTGNPPGDEFDTEALTGVNSRLTLKIQKKKKDGTKFAKVIAILPPRKGDPLLLVPQWYKRTGGNTLPAAAVATATAPHTLTPPSVQAENNKLQSTMEASEPPEPPEWDPADYDDATGFPAEKAGVCEPAA